MEWINAHLLEAGKACVAVVALAALLEGVTLLFRAFRNQENNHG
jgi:hypothetical protein